MNFLSKLFFNSQSRDEENEMNYIVKGYPLTTSPVVPEILKHQVKYEKMNGKQDTPILALTLAHEGSDLVEPESLEVIRKNMLAWFNLYPDLAKHFEKELPRNLLAISFTANHFQMGEESCHDFKLAKGRKEAKNSFYTYQKMSESVQCAYYNVNGVEYLAGACFYPTPYGKPMLLESNDALMLIATACRMDYPLVDRKKSNSFVNFKSYGRYCASAGKRIVVTCDTSDGIPRHFEFNHVTKMFEKNLCYECTEEHFTYKWEEPKKDTPAPAVAVEESVPAAVTATDAETAPARGADSTESLIEGFEKIEVGSEDVESDIDAELID